MSHSKYPIRVLPWWTTEASRFLANLTKWYPEYLGRRVTAFEVGSGNSTFFLLSKGLQVTSVESDWGYIQHVKSVAEAAGYSVKIVDSVPGDTTDGDLTIVRTKPYDNKLNKPGFWYQDLGIDCLELDFDFLINDGVDRMFFMQKFHECENAIVILDNCEYAANWGRLMKASAKPDLINVYRRFLRDSSWTKILFEQIEGRNGRGVADATGWESNHRWLTAIGWHSSHCLTNLMVSNIGFPLVNAEGLNDADLTTLEKRCPFDWKSMRWELDEEYPQSLNLGLDRKPE